MKSIHIPTAENPILSFAGRHWPRTLLAGGLTFLCTVLSSGCPLQCKAFMVRDAGDARFEEEVPLSNLRGGLTKNSWMKSPAA